MKILCKITIVLTLGMFLTACGKNPVPSTATVIHLDIDAITTDVAATVQAQLMTASVPTVTTTPSPSETPIPTHSPTQLSALLESSISRESLPAFDGHTIQRITGWPQGFDGFSWWGTNHLLLRPITGRQWSEMQPQSPFLSRPAVINISSGKVLLNHIGVWSAQLNAIVTSDGLYSPDGDLIKAYNHGKLIDISPSGTKMLVETGEMDATWIDLLSEKKVVFPWHRTPRSAPIWSADEMQVYASDRLYGNAQTGESFAMTGTIMDGEKLDFLYEHNHAIWVLGGKYILPIGWSAPSDGTPGFLGILDINAKTYRNLSILAGIPYNFNMLPQTHPCNNNAPSGVPNGKYIWVDCADGGRLIDLSTFTSQTFQDYPEAYLEWSADGNFALIQHANSDKTQKILSAASKKLTAIPTDAKCVTWHPTQNSLAYISNQTLTIFNAGTMSVQKMVELPVAMHCFNWNARADKMALMAEDNSIWQIDTPTLGNIEQLTPPIKGLGWVVWSPDGSSIAFPVGADIYIVDVKRKP